MGISTIRKTNFAYKLLYCIKLIHRTMNRIKFWTELVGLSLKMQKIREHISKIIFKQRTWCVSASIWTFVPFLLQFKIVKWREMLLDNYTLTINSLNR